MCIILFLQYVELPPFPDGYIIRGLCARCRMSKMNAQELATVTYCLTRLQYQPSDAWMENCMKTFKAAMQHGCIPPALIKFLLASVKLGVSAGWQGLAAASPCCVSV